MTLQFIYVKNGEIDVKVCQRVKNYVLDKTAVMLKVIDNDSILR